MATDPWDGYLDDLEGSIEPQAPAPDLSKPSPFSIGNMKTPRGSRSNIQEFIHPKTPEEGVSLAAKNLRENYKGLTLAEIGKKWAPSSENNTAQWVKNVSLASGLKPEAAPNLDDPEQLQKLLTGIMTAEKAPQDRVHFTPSVLKTGVQTALGAMNPVGTAQAQEPPAVPGQTVAAPASLGPGAPSGGWDSYLDSLEKPATAVAQGQTKYAPQNFGIGRLPEMAGVAGLGSFNNLLGLPGDLANAAAGKIGSLFDSNPLEVKSGEGSAKIFPGSEDFANGGKFLGGFGPGLEGHPELRPQGALEEGVAGLFGAIPQMMAIGRSGLKANPLMAVATPLAAEAGAEGLKAIFPNSNVAPIVGGLLGSFAGAGGASGFESRLLKSRAVKEFAAAQAGLEKAVADAAALTNPDAGPRNALALTQQDKRLGDKQAMDKAREIKAQSRARLAGEQSTAETAETLADRDLAASHEGVAAKLGTSTTPQQTGELAQSNIRDWKQKIMPVKEAAVAEPLAVKMPNNTPAGLDNFKGIVTALTNKAGSLQPLVEAMGGNLPKRFLNILQGRDELDELTKTALPPPTVSEVRAFRTSIGDALKNPTLVKDANSQQLNALYAGLTHDIGATAKKVGAEAEWNTYNEEETRLHQIADGPMSKLASTTNEDKENILPGKAIENLLSTAKTDGTELKQLRSEVPNVVNEIAALALRTGQWKDLSIEAKEALVPDAGVRAQLGQAEVARANASAAAKRRLAQAKNDEQAIRDAAAKDTAEGRFTRTQAVVAAQRARETASFQAAEAERQAKARLASAAAALPPEPTRNELSLATIAKFGKAATGMGTAGSLGYGVFHDPQLAAIAALLGFAVPKAGKAVKSVAKRPANALVPVIGAVSGENALSPTRAEP